MALIRGGVTAQRPYSSIAEITEINALLIVAARANNLLAIQAIFRRHSIIVLDLYLCVEWHINAGIWLCLSLLSTLAIIFIFSAIRYIHLYAMFSKTDLGMVMVNLSIISVIILVLFDRGFHLYIANLARRLIIQKNSSCTKRRVHWQTL
jgi:hypothetical protein